eukprot:4645043-Amphidinium_carterae.2
MKEKVKAGGDLNLRAPTENTGRQGGCVQNIAHGTLLQHSGRGELRARFDEGKSIWSNGKGGPRCTRESLRRTQEQPGWSTWRYGRTELREHLAREAGQARHRH